MKQIFTGLFLIVCLSANAQIPDSVRQYIDISINIMQHKSLFAGRVDWPAAKREAYRQAAGATTYTQAFPAVAAVFEKLKDYHGMVAVDDASWRYPSPINFDTVLSTAIKQAFLKGPRIVTGQPAKGIGYIRIPSMNVFTQKDMDSHATSLRDSLCMLLRQHPQGLVIDLRMNSGGNSATMLAGIGPLFTGDTLGYGVDRTGKFLSPVVLKDGIPLDENGRPQVNIIGGCNKAEAIPVALITGYSTVSSGEILAIFLRQQKNVRVFGDRTGGFCNATEGFVFAGDHGYLLLSVNKIADASKVVNGEMIVRPDVYIKGLENYNTPACDAAVQAALHWIQSRS